MSVTESTSIEGRIDARVHDLDELRDAIERDWSELTDREKYLATTPIETIRDRLDVDDLDDQERELATLDVDSIEEVVSFNTTVDGLHESIVDNIDPTQTSDLEAEYLALGTDAASGTATSDSSLNNEVFRKAVTDHADQGASLLASTFVDSTEANGYTLDELGLFTSDTGGTNIMFNHATFPDVTKDNTKTVTFDVTLTFSAA